MRVSGKPKAKQLRAMKSITNWEFIPLLASKAEFALRFVSQEKKKSKIAHLADGKMIFTIFGRQRPFTLLLKTGRSTED